ncbi:MAG: hypothetical protein WAT43_13330 [Chitinophagales bacterium]
MRITLLLIFALFFAGQTAYSQFESETASDFTDEINEILLHADKGKTNRIICKFNEYQPSFNRSFFKDVIKFEFLNDTIIEQSQYGNKNYWLNRSGKLVEIEYDKKNSLFKTPFIDSAGYKVYYYVSNRITDTIYYYTRLKIDSVSKSEETFSRQTSSKSGQVTTKYKKESIGDTSYTYLYRLTSGEWELIYDIKEWKVLTNDNVNDAPTVIIQYRYEANGNITKSITTIKTVFSYDNIGRLTSVTKFFYLDYDENWYEKYVMTVKYVTR